LIESLPYFYSKKEQMTLREAIIEEVREKSLEIGEKRGEKRGKQIGKQIGKKITAHKTAFRLFDKGYDVVQICDLLEWEVNTVQESFDLYRNLQDNNQEALNNAILGFFQEGYEVEQVCELLNWQPEIVQPLFDRFVENRGKEEDNDLD
jgi:Fe-S cluster assembly scaffold protein SufB